MNMQLTRGNESMEIVDKKVFSLNERIRLTEAVETLNPAMQSIL